jgi:hypothetical protein
MSYAGCVTLFKTRQSHAARFSFMPVVLKSPGLKPIEAQNARSRSARVPYTASQTTGAAWYPSWACFESGRINQSVRTAASHVMRSARRWLPARKPNAMAIPQQTIKILGTLVLGKDHAFDWHAKSFTQRPTAGITRRLRRRMVLACVPSRILRHPKQLRRPYVVDILGMSPVGTQQT